IGTPVNFRAIFEIGPVDGQTSRVLNADGTAWAVLLPMCDGDVSDLEGVKPFDRMLGLVSERRDAPKSTFIAWGTNHNYFNTEWQESDSAGCQSHLSLFSSGQGVTGSAEQRQIGLRSLLAFFSANVGPGNNRTLNDLFDPTAPLASSTRIDRGHTPSLRPSRGITLEDFSGPSGTSAHGLPLSARGLQLSHGSVPEHDEQLHAASLEFAARPAESPDPRETGAADARALEVPVSAAPEGVDLGAYTHLEFRAGRVAGGDLLDPTQLVVQLVNADGSVSNGVDTAAHGLRLDGPVGGPYNTHVVLQTVRIPFSAFAGGRREALRAVRFVFPGAAGAQLYLANVRASLGSASLSPAGAGRSTAPSASDARAADTNRTRRAAPAVGTPPAGPIAEGAAGAPIAAHPAAGVPAAIVPSARAPVARQLLSDGNTLVALRPVDGHIELELSTPNPFRAQGDQLVLDIGDARTTRSRHPDGDLGRVVFSLSIAQYNAARDGDALRVHYAASDVRQWDFGVLDKSRLAP
ncbi:MAG TPA: hypothetical protein VMG12_30000, partial [Polyangiaceae bacterium]|nr:hypothetical protein [Polyangiaceae bacterium]